MWGLGVSRGRRLLAVRKAGKRRHGSSGRCSALRSRRPLIARHCPANAAEFLRCAIVSCLQSKVECSRECSSRAGRQLNSRKEKQASMQAGTAVVHHKRQALARHRLSFMEEATHRRLLWWREELGLRLQERADMSAGARRVVAAASGPADATPCGHWVARPIPGAPSQLVANSQEETQRRRRGASVLMCAFPRPRLAPTMLQ